MGYVFFYTPCSSILLCVFLSIVMLKIRFLLQSYKFTEVDERARRLQEDIILVSKSWGQKRISSDIFSAQF